MRRFETNVRTLLADQRSLMDSIARHYNLVEWIETPQPRHRNRRLCDDFYPLHPHAPTTHPTLPASMPSSMPRAFFIINPSPANRCALRGAVPSKSITCVRALSQSPHPVRASTPLSQPTPSVSSFPRHTTPSPGPPSRAASLWRSFEGGLERERNSTAIASLRAQELI
jgi:hypothetical protein